MKIGSVPHPMAEEHYIEWAQLIVGDLSYRIFLNPGGAPEALFAAPPENRLRAGILQPARSLEKQLIAS